MDECAHDADERPAQAAAEARDRVRTVRRVFIATLAINAAVALSKGIYSYVSGSVALGTDSLHSLLDASSNVLALLGLHWASRPADVRHPYGRRKIELLAALGIGVLIVIGLFELASAAIVSIRGQRAAPQIGAGGFALVLGTIAVNAWVSRYEERRGHQLHSVLLCADARHTRSDLYGSIAVVLSFLAIRAGVHWADGVGALAIVILIGREAWFVFRDNIPALIDAAVLDPKYVAHLAESIAGVENVHRVRSRGMPGAVELDLHMQVAAKMSVSDAHDLASRIEQDLRVKFPELSDVVIHIEPGPTAAPGTSPTEDGPTPATNSGDEKSDKGSAGT